MYKITSDELCNISIQISQLMSSHFVKKNAQPKKNLMICPECVDGQNRNKLENKARDTALQWGGIELSLHTMIYSKYEAGIYFTFLRVHKSTFLRYLMRIDNSCRIL